jgi:hypothetical protein
LATCFDRGGHPQDFQLFQNVNVLHLQIAGVISLRCQLHLSDYLRLKQNMVKIFTAFRAISAVLLSALQIAVLLAVMLMRNT